MGELKPGWRRVKFGEVVRQVKDRVDPDTSGLERFVAGEHMDTDDLRIRRWGTIGDGYLGPAFHMRFRPGHVLYGSRRTYLRKVAAADFEGICANTTFVLTTVDPKVLMPELLPFIMRTETFHEHSKRESKGSVNPYVNFSDLAWYEFALPPIEQQRRIVTALSSGATVEQELKALIESAESVMRATLLHVFSDADRPKSLQELCRTPITYGIVQAGPHIPDGVPYVRVSEMTERDELDAASMLRTTDEIHRSYGRTILEEGDIVVALRGVPGFCHQVQGSLAGANLSRGVARVAVNSQNNPAYVLWALRSPQVQGAIRQHANGWKGESLRELTIAGLRSLPIPWVNQSKQNALVEKLNALQSAIRAARDRSAVAHVTQTRLSAQFLHG